MALTTLIIPTRTLPVVPSDGTDLSTYACLGVYVGGAGNLVVQGLNDAAPITLAVPAGTILRLQVKKIMAATTATSIALLLP